jgi:hypothetical protein
LDSRRRTIFTDGGSLQLIALGNSTKGVRPHLKTNALPVDQTLFSLAASDRSHAGDFDGKRIELDKPYRSILVSIAHLIFFRPCSFLSWV